MSRSRAERESFVLESGSDLPAQTIFMKTEIIVMLEFPRRMIQGNIPLETCEHAGNFSSSDPACLVCDLTGKP